MELNQATVREFFQEELAAIEREAVSFVLNPERGERFTLQQIDNHLSCMLSMQYDLEQSLKETIKSSMCNPLNIKKQ